MLSATTDKRILRKLFDKANKMFVIPYIQNEALKMMRQFSNVQMGDNHRKNLLASLEEKVLKELTKKFLDEVLDDLKEMREKKK